MGVEVTAENGKITFHRGDDVEGETLTTATPGPEEVSVDQSATGSPTIKSSDKDKDKK